MLHRPVSRRTLLAGALGTSAALVLPGVGFPAVKKGTALRLWILKTTSSPRTRPSRRRRPCLVMKDSYGQFAPVLDKARTAAKDYFNKNENYRTFGRAAEWFVGTGWPGPVTAAAAEVQASNVLTDAPAKVIVDKWSVDQAIDWADKKIKEIYDTLGA